MDLNGHNEEDAVELPVDGVLDLHTFHPGELKDLLPDYLEACRQKGILQVRIIHGKGRGVLRRTVQSILGRLPGIYSVKITAARQKDEPPFKEEINIKDNHQSRNIRDGLRLFGFTDRAFKRQGQRRDEQRGLLDQKEKGRTEKTARGNRKPCPRGPDRVLP